MASVKYTYSIQDNFPNHKVASDRLEVEIRASAILVALDFIGTSGDDCDIWFKAALSTEEEGLLDAVVSAHSGEPLPDTLQPKVSNFQRLEVEIYKAAGKGLILCSHNFCDPCSWYTQSAKLEDQTLPPVNSDYTLYRSMKKHWIDLFHGRVTREGNFNDAYKAVVKVNGTEKVEGIDFIIDYEHGEVLFAWDNPFLSDCAYKGGAQPPKLGMGPLQDTDVVTATFVYAQGSMWVIRPNPGKMIRIEKTEVQHTQDSLVHSALIFQPWMPVPGYPGMMMPVPEEYGGELSVYKGARDFVNEGNQGVGFITAFGGGAVKGMTQRGLRHNVSVYPFDYLASKDLNGSLGIELRVWCLNDVPLDGEFGTVTCYCTVEDA